MQARDIMTSHPICVTPRTRVKDAIDVMSSSDVRHVPVLEDERLVGIVSERNLASVWDLAFDPSINDGRLFDRRVADFMSSSPITVDTDADVDEVIELLVEHRIGAVLVVDAEGALTGIISYVDVLKAALGKL